MDTPIELSTCNCKWLSATWYFTQAASSYMGRSIRAQIQNWIHTSVDFQGLLPFRKQTSPLEDSVQVLWQGCTSHTPLYSWTQAHCFGAVNVLNKVWITWLGPSRMRLVAAASAAHSWCWVAQHLTIQVWHSVGSGHPSMARVGQPIPDFFCNSTRMSLHSGGPQGTHTFGTDFSTGSSSGGFSLGNKRTCEGASHLKTKMFVNY